MEFIPDCLLMMMKQRQTKQLCGMFRSSTHYSGISRHMDSPTRSSQANLHLGLGTSCKPSGTEVLIPAVGHNHPTAFTGGAECHHCEHPD